MDVARLALYWPCCPPAWRCPGYVANPLWTLLSGAALPAGLVASVLA